MNGLIVINKEAGMTSHDVVNEIRHIFKTKQVGHLGTLDPLATGVLVVCLGDATKLVQFLESVNKEYECEIMVGLETDTYDITGKCLCQKKVYYLDEKKVDDALLSFFGKSMQIPPIYSAIKKDGKKLYEYARKNIEVEIEPREIEVTKVKRTSDITYIDGCAKFSFVIEVSKGTYIRSICHDLGIKLGLCATMSNLKRIKNGNFDIEHSYTLDDIKNGQFQLINLIDALSNFDKIDNDEVVKKAENGMKISLIMIKDILGKLPEKIAICHNNKLTAIYLRGDELHCYKAGRVWK